MAHRNRATDPRDSGKIEQLSSGWPHTFTDTAAARNMRLKRTQPFRPENNQSMTRPGEPLPNQGRRYSRPPRQDQRRYFAQSGRPYTAKTMLAASTST